MASMKLSFFTPTNNPKWLLDTFASLRIQTYRNFEWVIVPNGGITPANIPAEIAAWDKVRIVPGPDAKNIGALKRFACDNCVGDMFCELDHDDLLLPDAAKHIADAAAKGGFVYSDDAIFRNDGKMSPFKFGEKFGWESYLLYVYNRPFLATRAFDITPRSLCEVYFAPDHIRCWSRAAYYKAGGHDPTMLVGDDHDLICRTYLAGVPFAHTGHCDYLYRAHQDNSYRKHQSEVVRLQTRNCNRYLYPLITEWCRRNRLESLDLSECVDRQEMHFRLADRPNRLGHVRIMSKLQRLDQADLGFVLNRINNALVPDGFFSFCCPSTDGPDAFLPRNRSYWNAEVSRYLTDRRNPAPLPSYHGGFQQVRCWQGYVDKTAEQRKSPSVYADWMATKGQRSPGVPFVKGEVKDDPAGNRRAR